MRSVFAHARMQRAASDNVLLRLRHGGLEGVGECVPRDYVTGETPGSVIAAITSLDLETVWSRLPAGSFGEAVRAVEALDLAERLRHGTRPALATACCVELALLDLLAQREGVSIRETAAAMGLPSSWLRSPAERHPLTRVLDGSRTPEQALGQPPFLPVLKIKVGLGRELDVARVKACRELGGPDLTIAVDANMAWSLDEACTMADLLRPFSIAWYEEPLAQRELDQCRVLRERTDVRVMLDESLCSMSDARDAIEAGASDLWNIRLSKCGGLVASLRLVEMARAHGLQYQLGTHPGAEAVLRAAEWQLACTIDGFVAVEAVPSQRVFEEELVRERLEVDFQEGKLVPLRGPGLGVTLDAERADAFATQRAAYDAGTWTTAS